MSIRNSRQNRHRNWLNKRRFESIMDSAEKLCESHDWPEQYAKGWIDALSFVQVALDAAMDEKAARLEAKGK